MPLDYQTTLYDPIYSVLGVSATIVLDDTAATSLAVTALDKTAGVDVGGGVDVQTIEPAAVVRYDEITTANLGSLENAVITLNSKAWRVASYMLRPSPGGEADGEVYLILADDAP